ncbi:bifunctional DNA primase/polymerase [Pseudalkalibacillus salsuginis]|uniref:bifunctional DNA primase/polymerase n=1 Tax=Pseudalkalibacillus salsuginis TaxID=2910972 RepID=UPI001F429F76|nr:bifunctional DNA primase/polymerase [Pseudalkalibacillus salsuginis]MCF6409009.1 bifunctional DNA primase/polymerase [Pseudalkalibacillus salsuginis]
MHISAIAYTQSLGWPVIPLHGISFDNCTCGRQCGSEGKHPLIAKGVHAATRDLHLINQWWKKWPQANIGIPTGSISGVIALDIDPRNGGDDSFHNLMVEHGRLPQTVEALTGGDGRHILFKTSPYRRIKNKVGILPGIDIRGDGGYIVVSPSVHISGQRYKWEVSSRPDKSPLANIPEWLFRLIGDPQQEKKIKKPASYWIEILKGVPEGNRNMSAASLAGYLLRHGIAAPVAYEIMLLWNERNTPPESQKVMETTFNSILKREIERLKGRGMNGDKHPTNG